VQLGLNLSHNGVTDTLESSTILIYSDEHMSLCTQSFRQNAKMSKWLRETEDHLLYSESLIKSNGAGSSSVAN
jgi:hypothetical protein